MNYLSKDMLKKVIYFSSWILLAYSLYFLFLTIDPGHFFNSDILYLPSLYNDLFIDKFSLSGWSLPPSPYFFPDMLIFFGAMFFTGGDIATSFILSGAIQFISLVLIFNFILKIILKRDDRVGQTFILLTGALLNLLVTGKIGDHILATIYIPSLHNGVFIVSLIAFGVVLKALRDEKNLKNYIIISLFCLLCVVSDQLYIVIFALPIIFTLVFLTMLNIVPLKKTLLLSSVIILTTIISLGILHFIKHYIVWIPENPTRLSWERLSASLTVFSRDSEYFFTGNSIYFTIGWFLWLLISISVAAYFIKNRNNKNILSKSHYYNLQLLFFIVFSIILVLITLTAPILTGIYVDRGSFRYLTPAFAVPLFGIAIYFSYFFFSLAKERVSIATVTILALSLFFYTGYLRMDRKTNNITLLNYYPELTQCLDSHSSIYNLSFGLSGYWNAKLNTILSKNNLRVYQVAADLNLYHWSNNMEWYLNEKISKLEKPQFNFIVLGHVKKNIAIEKFGPPAEILKCASSEVFIYNRPSDFKFRNHFNRERKLLLYRLKKYHEFKINGEDLIGVVGEIDGKDRVARGGKTPKGFLSVGPFLNLSRGKYEISLIYESESESDVVGKFGILFFHEKRRELIEEGKIAGGKKSIRLIRTRFSITNQKNTPVAFVLWYSGQGNLSIKELAVKQL